ncbi:MAG: PAS domain S-box protein [Bacteroidales bacterium]
MKNGKLIEALKISRFGYALHKVIIDENNNPVDYRFLEVNKAFEDITGLKAEEIEGKLVREVIPHIEEDSFDWISYYGNIALNNGNETFERYSETLDKWFQVQAFSPEYGKFITIFSDITEVKNKSAELEAFFSVNIDLLSISDFKGNIVKVNREWESVLGYSADDLQKKTFLEFVHPDDLEKTLLALNELKKGKKIMNFVNRFRSQKGSYRYIEWRSHTNGNLVFSAARDITERFVMESSLRESEANFRTFFNSIEEFLFVLDCDGKILKINESVTRGLGYTEAELTGENLFKLHPPERLEEAKNVFIKLISCDSNFCNIPILTSNGEIIEVESKVYPGFWNGQKCFFGVVKDVSGIVKSEEKFKMAFQAGATLMAISDIKTGKFIDVNNSFLLTTGYTKEEVIGQTANNLSIFFDPNDREMVLSIVKEKGFAKDVELKIRVKSGDVRTGLFSINKLVIGNLSCWLTSMIDITERKSAEASLEVAIVEAEIANRTKSEFISNMSHEIRTPLNGVIGFTDLLMQTSLNEEQMQYASIVNISGKRLLEMINDILDFSKIESGSSDLNYREVNTLDLFDRIVECSKKQADLKGLNFIKNISAKVPDMVIIDPVRFRQIIMNLLSNAVKFTERGDVELKVKFKDSGNNTGRFDVFVRDTGIGIPIEQQKNLFRAFSQGDTSKTRKYGGTGLGLAISQLLAKQMGGYINVESMPGEGSLFQFTIEVIYRNEPVPVFADKIS